MTRDELAQRLERAADGYKLPIVGDLPLGTLLREAAAELRRPAAAEVEEMARQLDRVVEINKELDILKGMLVLREAAALLRRLAPFPIEDGWRPIEEAPKDGAEIDVWVQTRYKDGRKGDGERMTNAHWGKYNGDWNQRTRSYEQIPDWVHLDTREGANIPIEGDYNSYSMTMTHWRPLPAPPSLPDSAETEEKR